MFSMGRFASMLLISLFTSIMILLTACQTIPTPTPPASSDPDAMERLTQDQACSTINNGIDINDLIPFELEGNKCFVSCEVLITGPKRDVEGVARDFGLILLDTLEDRPRVLSNNRVITNLYYTDKFVQDVVARINGMEDSVHADPNFLIGDQLTIEGSSSWSIAGSPMPGIAGNNGPTDESPAMYFENQWAFEGIKHFARDPLTGENVVIGIFDTSPFSPISSLSGVETIEDTELPPKISVPFQSKPFPNLSISYFTSTVSITLTQGVDVSDHGLFVASLAKGVAVGSEIRLYQVLNQYAQGDLATLVKALNAFNALIGETNRNPVTRKDSVINLSLGVHQCEPFLDNDYEINSLITVLNTAENQGTVIVAAAGNADSSIADIPARYENIIGVEAHGLSKQKTCYSNPGDVSAPGGNGYDPSEDSASKYACVPYAHTCTDANCEYGLVGASSSSSTGYAYWSGTSFATPLVSGMAALAFEALSTSDLPSNNINECIKESSTVLDGQAGPVHINKMLECLSNNQ